MLKSVKKSSILLPVDKPWYRKLIAYALLMSAVGGLSATLYSAVTEGGISFFFGEVESDFWSGQWWWIPLVAFGALIVTWIRSEWGMTGKIPGAVGFAKKARVDPLGALFSAPLFGTIMAGELSPTPKKNYLAAFTPRLIAATIGYAIFFGVTGKVMLDAFSLPEYTFQFKDLLIAAFLGLVSIVVILIYILIGRITAKAFSKFSNNQLKTVVGGAVVGFWLLPFR